MTKNIRKLIQKGRGYIRCIQCEDETELALLLNDFGLYVYRDPQYEGDFPTCLLVTNKPLTFRRYVNWGRSNQDDWPGEWVKSMEFPLDEEMVKWRVE